MAGLDRLLADQRPDVVHLHNVVNPWMLERAAAWPSLVTVQDHRAFCPGRGKWTAGGQPCSAPMTATRCEDCFTEPGYAAGIIALTHRRLDALRTLPLTVLSRYMAGELAAAGVRREGIHVIPPFVHALEPADDEEVEPCVLFCGRLVAAKGVEDAVEAWRGSGVDLPLVFAGTGSSRAELEAGGHRVTGWLPRPRLAAWYRAARALVLPSRWQEPFGIVGLEALSLGTPVAAWRSGGVAEWHPGGPTLVPWGDVSAIARALRTAVDDSDGEVPRRAASGFPRRAAMDRLEELYARVSTGA